MCMYRSIELELSPIYTHHACTHNAYIGLTARHLLDNIPEVDWLEHTDRGTRMLRQDSLLDIGCTQLEAFRAGQAALSRWIDGRRTPLLSVDEYCKRFGGFKRQRLVRSYNETSRNCKLDWRITAMVKCDKYDLEKAIGKPPRMIQFRKPGTNVELAKAVCIAEHELLSGPGLGPTRLPMSSKGMSIERRAQVWAAKRLAFKRPVCIAADYEKMDAHLHTHTLSGIGHRAWREMTGLPLRMLNNTLFNRGRVGTLSYKAVGTRMSGEQTTGGENTVISVSIVQSVADMLKIKIEMLVDGDDGVFYVEEEHVDTFLLALHEVCQKVHGLKIKTEAIRDPAEEEYCQSHLAYRPDGTPHCIIDPIRALRRMTHTVNQCGARKMHELLIGNLVASYLMYPNTPVLTKATYGLLEALGAVKDHRVIVPYDVGNNNQWLREKRLQHITPHIKKCEGRFTTHLPREFLEISELERFHCFRAYGLSPEFQEHVERTFPIGTLNPTIKRAPAKTTKQVAGEAMIWSNDMSSMMPDIDYTRGYTAP